MLSHWGFQTVVHALLWRESAEGLQICLHQRQQTKVMDGYWLCPGGRMAAGERPAVSVCREIQEELGVQAINPRLIGLLTFATAVHPKTAVEKTMGVNYVFATNRWRGETYAAEPHLHSAPAFFPVENLPDPHPKWLKDVAENLLRGGSTLMQHYSG